MRELTPQIPTPELGASEPVNVKVPPDFSVPVTIPVQVWLIGDGM